MERVVRFRDEDLEWASTLTPESRLAQANVAFRLCHDLHRPFAVPIARGFDTFEELRRFEEEHDLPR
jgi:hypothetical protein